MRGWMGSPRGRTMVDAPKPSAWKWRCTRNHDHTGLSYTERGRICPDCFHEPTPLDETEGDMVGEAPLYTLDAAREMCAREIEAEAESLADLLAESPHDEIVTREAILAVARHLRRTER